MKRLVAPALLVVCLALACGRSPSDMAGTYAADRDGEEVSLTLNPDGKGGWIVAGETAPITWEKRSGDRLWLHTRQGGVMEARVEGRTLVVEMPGGGTFIFSKQ